MNNYLCHKVFTKFQAWIFGKGFRLDFTLAIIIIIVKIIIVLMNKLFFLNFMGYRVTAIFRGCVRLDGAVNMEKIIIPRGVNMFKVNNNRSERGEHPRWEPRAALTVRRTNFCLFTSLFVCCPMVDWILIEKITFLINRLDLILLLFGKLLFKKKYRLQGFY